MKLTSRNRLPTGVNRMIHVVDVRCTGFLYELVLQDFHQSANLTLSGASKLVVSFLVFPGQTASFRREVRRLGVSTLICVLPSRASEC